jgi:hypothetical protein
MKLTIEKNREAIKRFRHVRPARGAVSCSETCPGTSCTCTLENGHGGLHVAHGTFGRVVAVWDEGAESARPTPRGRRLGTSRPPIPSRPGGSSSTLRNIVRRLVERAPGVEEIVLLILALSMVGFAIDWILQIFGGR